MSPYISRIWEIPIILMLPTGTLSPCYVVDNQKNLGRLWLAYTELQGDFYMLQLISVDSRHFTQSQISSKGVGCL